MKKLDIFFILALLFLFVGVFIASFLFLPPLFIVEIPKATKSDTETVRVTASIAETAPETLSNAQEYAQKKVKEMSLEEKVGQLFFVRCPAENAAGLALSYQPGGYLLFAGDFEYNTPSDMCAIIQSYQNASQIPMLIGVDEEGGTVTRISRFAQYRSERFSSPQEIFAGTGYAGIQKDTVEKAKLLLSLGVNLNLAPVCDVSTNPNDFMNARSFGKKAVETAEYVRIVVEEMNAQGMIGVLKHFPGYGNTADTHIGMAHSSRTYEEFQQEDFLPFIAGIKAGVGSILVSHVVVDCMDTEFPASLSSKVHEILRKELHFDGVILTDDLSMEAIKEYASENDPILMAISAGNDCIVTSDFPEGYNRLLEAVKTNKIAESRIDASVVRILTLKYEKNLIPH